jgi:cellulose synthase/poly-beta-1,6-N-acetylglucosamine synthase-like glycosyltransferase/glycosyltransferase involved in cell wall biosynthesis/O-antigen/teichoic acid export membrane protein
MGNFDKISIIVPAHNEEANIEPLVGRIHEALSKEGIHYEILFVNDYSTDKTADIVKKVSAVYPVKLIQKMGKKGKSYSINEGIRYASFKTVAMIDADLQYPPEAIPSMIKLLSKSDVVVSNRKRYEEKPTRKFLSNSFKLVFGKTLFGLRHDIQSGLKVFKKEVYDSVSFEPSSSWTFDLEFLHRAREAGYKIEDFDIVFSKREKGKSKVGFLGTTLEIGLNALKLKGRRIHPAQIPPENKNSMVGAGVGYKRKRYITHTTMPHHFSALRTFTKFQKAIIFGLISLIGIGLYLNLILTLQILVGALSAIYFLDVIFNLYLIIKSLSFPKEISSTEEEINSLDDKELPVYTILCPLYKEAQIIPQFVDAIDKLSWPKEKLDVILLLEEDDKDTIEKASRMNLPSFVRTLVVPHSIPKTKPKACNYGLAHAKGEYLVIYDAEDIPDPLQLKKAFLGFKKVDENVICLQAKLNYYNPHQNLLTRFFTAEYSLWFDITLPGLQSVNTALPLGGTSNHFKTKNLIEVEGWDPFNVTEDADLGVRLFKKGYKTAMIDSVTLEEANSKVGNWFRQRSRWIKGYMQTYLVHTRGHKSSVKKQALHSLIFQLVVGGKIAFVLINPLLWVATFAYFALYSFVGPQIERLYPSIVFYMAVTSLVLGNFLFLYYYMIGLAKRGQWNLIKFVYLIPIYWLMLSISAAIAFYQLLFKPHYWEKTVHGLHLKKAQKKAIAEVAVEVEREREQGLMPESAKSRLAFNLSKKYIAGAAFIIATGVGSFFNFLYNAYLGRTLKLEDFALIGLIGGIYSFVLLVSGSFSAAVAYQTGFLFGKKNEKMAFTVWKSIRRKALMASVVFSALWLALVPFMTSFFKIDDLLPLVLFTPLIFTCLIYAADKGYLTAKLAFGFLASLVLIEPIIKFGTSIILVENNLGQYAYFAIPLSVVSAFVLTWALAAIGKRKQDREPSLQTEFPKKLLASALLTGVSTVVLINLDVVMAKHFLPERDAGLYALLSLVGKMIFFLGSFATPFIIPLVSRGEGESKDTGHVLKYTLIAVSMLVFPAALTLGFFSDMLGHLLFGEKISPVVKYILPVSLGMSCFALARVFIDYQVSKKNYILPLSLLILGFAQIALINFFPKSVSNIAYITSGVWGSSLIFAFVFHLLSERLRAIGNNLLDLSGLFTGSVQVQRNIDEDKLRILVFNWRDTRHKWAGGAEVYLHEIAKRWVKEGHAVTMFVGNDGKLKRNAVIDGVNIVRRGGNYTVYLWAFFYYAVKFRGEYDIIIDSENGIPFFSPLYVREKVVLVVHHIHQEVFSQHLKFPLSSFAKYLEGGLMPSVYRRNQIVTVSESSKIDLINLGLGRSDSVSIVNPGLEAPFFTSAKKAKNPVFTYVGRLKPYKNVDVAIRAFAQVVATYKNAKLVIIGEGESKEYLQTLAKELDLGKNIIFTGRVDNKEKNRLLSGSWVVLQPSMVEGWGITVIESNAAGTPVIASNVNGLKDSVLHGKTGILVPVRDVDALSKAMIDFVIDSKYREKISKNAYLWSQNFDWDKSARQFLNIITAVHREQGLRMKKIQIALGRFLSMF